MPKTKNKQLIILLLVVLVITLTIFNISYYNTRPQKVLATSTNTPLTNREEYWIDFLKKNPSYFDGWIELAKIEYKLEKRNAARGALKRAEKIKPNSEKLYEIKTLLED